MTCCLHARQTEERLNHINRATVTVTSICIPKTTSEATGPGTAVLSAIGGVTCAPRCTAVPCSGIAAANGPFVRTGLAW